MKLPRIHARVSLSASARLEAAESAPADYEITNLSAGGALLLGGPHLDVDTAIDLALNLAGDEPLEVSARVVRHERLGQGREAMGVRFVEVSEETEAKLAKVVAEAYRSLGARILGQVRTQMERSGVTDVNRIADELHRMKEEQAKAHLFGADLFTDQGSDTAAAIVSATDGVSRECIVWSLNLYLGLNRNSRVIEKTRTATAAYGTGSGTSAPSLGLSKLHRQIETRIASMVGKEQALVFPTGYSANLAALSSLPGPNDLVLMDRECHASMFDGVRLSGRKYLPFRHNDVDDLAQKLERFGSRHENIFVVVESAYSMSGDLAPLKEIAALKQKHRFFLYVDEAHTFGFYGDQGKGYCHEQGVTDQVDFIMSTFSKATASIGGFIAGEARFCTLLQAVATPYIFQACLTPPAAATILAALDEIENEPIHAERLHESNRYMRQLLKEEGFDLGTSQSPVIPVYVPDLEKLYRLCAHLYLEGIFSVPVVYPAVGVNEGRIRFIVNAHHTDEQIERTVQVLGTHARTLGIL